MGDTGETGAEHTLRMAGAREMPFSSEVLPGCSKQEVTSRRGGETTGGEELRHGGGLLRGASSGEEGGCALTFPPPNSPLGHP